MKRCMRLQMTFPSKCLFTDITVIRSDIRMYHNMPLHSLIHTEEKRYICTACGKKFREKEIWMFTPEYILVKNRTHVTHVKRHSMIDVTGRGMLWYIPYRTFIWHNITSMYSHVSGQYWLVLPVWYVWSQI
jgi:hypothetical protein